MYFECRPNFGRRWGTNRSLVCPEETHAKCSGISTSCMSFKPHFSWWNRNFVSDNTWQVCTHERLLINLKRKTNIQYKSSPSDNVRLEKHVIKEIEKKRQTKGRVWQIWIKVLYCVL